MQTTVRNLRLSLATLLALSWFIGAVAPLTPVLRPLQQLSPVGNASAQALTCEYPPVDEPDNDGDECNPNFLGQLSKPKNTGTDCDCNNKDAVAPGGTHAGDPINFATGSLYEEDRDYAGAGPFPLTFTRYHDSLNTAIVHNLGRTFSSSYSRAVVVTASTATAPTSVNVVRDSGRTYAFALQSGAWVGDGDVNSTLAQTPTGWTYTTASSDVETYDSAGHLLTVTNAAGVTQTVSYDTQHRMVKVADPFGHALTFAYVSATSPLLQSFTNPLGQTFSYSYDSANRMIALTNPDAGVKKYVYENSAFPNLITGIVDELGARYFTATYDANGLTIATQHAGGADRTSVDYTFRSIGVVKVTNPLGAATSHLLDASTGTARVIQASVACTNCANTTSSNGSTRDAHGNPVAIIDFRGNSTKSTFDLSRNLETQRILPLGGTIQTTWHPTYRLPVQIVEATRTTSLTYDTNGNLRTKSVAPSVGSPGTTSTWTWTYNSAGQPLTATDPNGNVAQYAYDSASNLASSTNALNQVLTVTSYDAAGRPLGLTDPNGTQSSFTYNFRGQLLTRKVGGLLTTYKRDAVGNVVMQTNPDGSTLSFSYDAAHRLTSVVDALGNRIVYTLDAMGNVKGEDVFDASHAHVRWHTYAYDSLGQLLQDNHANVAEAVKYSRDAMGNVTGINAPTLNPTSKSYDANNRLSQISNGHTINLGYDALNRLNKVTDGRGLVTSYSYNVLDEPVQVVSPDSGTTAKTYDPAGNLLTQTDANGKVTTYIYDKLNRVTKLAVTGGEAVTYSYDQGTNGIGHLTTMTDPTGSTQWVYDALGRVIAKTRKVGTTTLITSYAYSATTGQLTSMTYPSGMQVTYSYNANGQPLALAYARKGATTTSPLISAITWQPFGPVASWKMANGGTYARSYSPDGVVAAIKMPAATTLTFGYNAGLNISRISETGLPDKTFYYDGFSHLYQYNASSNYETFRYDTNSDNRIAETIFNGTTTTNLTYGYGTTSNRLLSIATNGKATDTYTFDPAGNTTKHVAPTQTLGFTYNSRNRLAQANVGAAVTSYGIDGLGQRVSKATAGGAATTFDYGGDGQIIGRYDATIGSEETIYLAGMPVGLVMPAAVYFVASDQLGAPHQLTDSTGAPAWLWNHEPFGDSAASGQLTTYSGRFPGQFFDVDNGLSYNYFRNYDAKIGRYVESDPIGLEGGINPYVYVSQNPSNSFDRKGTLEGWDDLTAAGVGALVGLGSQAYSDIVNGSKFEWENYAGSAIGGAFTGVVALNAAYFGVANPYAIGALAGGSTNAAKQWLKMARHKQCNFNYGTFAFDTAIGAIFGKLGDRFKPVQPGINSGIGSYGSISKRIITQLDKGSIKSFSPSTSYKIAIYSQVDGATGTAIGIPFSAIEDHINGDDD